MYILILRQLTDEQLVSLAMTAVDAAVYATRQENGGEKWLARIENHAALLTLLMERACEHDWTLSLDTYDRNEMLRSMEHAFDLLAGIARFRFSRLGKSSATWEAYRAGLIIARNDVGNTPIANALAAVSTLQRPSG